MTRLHDELDRLFHPPATDPAVGTGLFDADGRTRALVLAIGAPPAWAPLAAVWSGVQVELGWPAPAIAVDGQDALQLWFPLAAPVDAGTAQAVLDALRRRFLADVPAARVRLLPDAATGGSPRHAAPVPAAQPGGDRWSAFVAPDLAPLFADTPWLDLPPGDAAQARILAGIGCVTPAQVDAVLRPPAPSTPASAEAEADAVADAPAGAADPSPAFDVADTADPRAFLLAVMRDPRVPLALRVQAAVALLPGGAPTR